MTYLGIILLGALSLSCSTTTVFAASTSLGAQQQGNNASHLDSRIVGGHAIDMTEAPYQVSLRSKEAEKKKFGSGHTCGGSVISQRVILTAAHCIAIRQTNPLAYRQPSEFMVVMGSVYLYRETKTTRRFNVIDIKHHPGFDMEIMANDLALIFIDGFIPYNLTTVKPIPLNRYVETIGTNCLVSGWGTTKENGVVSSELLAVSVPIVSTRTCATIYNNITNGNLCAGYLSTGGRDACQGDSGGPLACYGVLAGVVSYGAGCGRPIFVGVYANVSDFYNWIVYTNSTFNYTYYMNVPAGYDGSGIVGIHSHPLFLISGALLMLFLLGSNSKSST